MWQPSGTQARPAIGQGMNTERADPTFAAIETWPTDKAVAALLEAQACAIAAVQRAGEGIAAAAEEAAQRLGLTGCLAYAGAGTSGRIGVQDGVELTPTYGWPEHRLVFLIAGGETAFMRAVEGAEDDAVAGAAAVREAGLASGDVLIGLAASGRTPFTIGALQEARARGCLTVGFANNPASPLLEAAEHGILLDTGPEVIAGSTRMGAGTAQKAALNALSTAIMLRLGFVYRGLMVNMRISNAKLRGRAEAMIAQVADVDEEAAAHALDAADGEIRTGVLIALGVDRADARALLAAAQEPFAAVVDRLRAQRPAP